MDKIWVDSHLSTFFKPGEKHVKWFGLVQDGRLILWSIGLIQDAPHDSERQKDQHFQISPKLQHFY